MTEITSNRHEKVKINEKKSGPSVYNIQINEYMGVSISYEWGFGVIYLILFYLILLK